MNRYLYFRIVLMIVQFPHYSHRDLFSSSSIYDAPKFKSTKKFNQINRNDQRTLSR